MKKVKLTQKEEEQIKELMEIQHQMGVLQLKSKKMYSDFWYEFQIRMGGGSYALDIEKGEVWKKSFEETVEENKK